WLEELLRLHNQIKTTPSKKDLDDLLKDLIQAFPTGCLCPPNPSADTITQLQVAFDALLLWSTSAPIPSDLKIQLQDAIHDVKTKLEAASFSCCDTLQSLQALLRVLTTIVNKLGLLNLLQKVKLLGLLQELQAIVTQSFSCLTCDKETGKFAYVANSGSDTVSVIDTSSNTVVATVPVEVAPHGIAVSPDETFVYVANTSSNTVSVIDTSSNTVVATVPVEITPFDVVVIPNGQFAYVTNAGSDTVSVIDTSSNTVVATVPVGSAPHGIAVTPDGQFAYV
ncbi:YncE family protein, partial [Bacillus mycoides]